MKTFEECCNYLGISEELPKCYVRERQHQAAYKLSVCMAAWNKQDEFEPDEKATWEESNVGYTPYFMLKGGGLLSAGYAHTGSPAGFVLAYASTAAAITSAPIGLRLCLKTHDRAIEFGEVFIEIFNELI